MDCHREILAAVKAPKRGFVPLGNKKKPGGWELIFGAFSICGY